MGSKREFSPAERYGVTTRSLRQVANDIMEQINSPEDATDDPWLLVSRKPEIQEILGRVSLHKQNGLIRFSQEQRRVFGNNYKIIEATAWSRLRYSLTRPWIIKTVASSLVAVGFYLCYVAAYVRYASTALLIPGMFLLINGVVLLIRVLATHLKKNGW